jgi:hypothetical protein
MGITTHSSFKKAKLNPSVFSPILSAIAWCSMVNLMPRPTFPRSTLSTHLRANATHSSRAGTAKVYLTSKRLGRLIIASSMRSGWFVVAIVRRSRCDGHAQSALFFLNELDGLAANTGILRQLCESMFERETVGKVKHIRIQGECLRACSKILRTPHSGPYASVRVQLITPRATKAYIAGCERLHIQRRI